MKAITPTRKGILTELKRRQDALKRYKVKRIGVFGSYVKGTQGKKSDIDFLVEFNEPTFDNFVNLAGYLEQLFGKKVDILTPEGIRSIRVKAVADAIKKTIAYV